MKKLSKKQWYVIGGAAVLALAIYLFWGDIKKLWEKSPEAVADTGVLDENRILGIGSKGAEVAALQRALIAEGFALPKFGVDGDFGKETLAALQQARGVDEITLKAFNATKTAKA